MQIPQEEIDKLNASTMESMFDGNAEIEEEAPVDEEPVKKVEEKVSASTDEDAAADKARIPYSRFETVNEEKIRAQERVKYLEEQLASKTPEAQTEELDLPSEWVELYGNSDEAKRAYGLQMSLNERMQEQAAQKAVEMIEGRKTDQEKIVQENLQVIEQELTSFSDTLGRKLTEGEENAILNIQDEFTPKDEDGRYLSKLLSPDKAFEIHTLRQAQTVAKTKQSKNRVLAVTGANSEADSSNASGKDYNSQAWGSWRDKLAE